MEFDEKIALETGPEIDGGADREAPDGAAPAAPRGRPFVKGQSGNPRGRPSRAHQAAWVGQNLIDRKTIQLVEGAVGWAQGRDKAMLRDCLRRVVPPRTEAPVWLKVPPIENGSDVKAALKAIANAVAQGDIPPAQGLRLVRMYTELWRFL